MEDNKQSPDLLIRSLVDGDMNVLDQIYDTYRDDFLRWAKSKFPAALRDDLLDAWHDTMIVFYEQVRDRLPKKSAPISIDQILIEYQILIGLAFPAFLGKLSPGPYLLSTYTLLRVRNNLYF